jgi:hypothetical protein
MKKILVLFLILSLALMGMGCSGWIQKNKRVATIVLLLTAMNSSKEHVDKRRNSRTKRVIMYILMSFMVTALSGSRY